jgi:hypothetical protein
MIKKFNNFLNEKIEQYDFGFTSEVESRDVDFVNEESLLDKSKEQYIDAGKLTVVWEMDFDNRKSGINSISPIIHKIYGVYTIVTPAEEGSDDEDEKDFVYERDSKDWEAMCEGELKFGYGIYPQSVEIDFKAKKINVIF